MSEKFDLEKLEFEGMELDCFSDKQIFIDNVGEIETVDDLFNAIRSCVLNVFENTLYEMRFLYDGKEIVFNFDVDNVRFKE
jgi:hypothetical protein